MAMKPIKLKDLLTQTKKPETQQIEIMEDYVLSLTPPTVETVGFLGLHFVNMSRIKTGKSASGGL